MKNVPHPQLPTVDSRTGPHNLHFTLLICEEARKLKGSLEGKGLDINEVGQWSARGRHSAAEAIFLQSGQPTKTSNRYWLQQPQSWFSDQFRGRSSTAVVAGATACALETRSPVVAP